MTADRVARGLWTAAAMIAVGTAAALLGWWLDSDRFPYSAVVVVLVVAVVWLLWDRGSLKDRADEASDTADRALALAHQLLNAHAETPGNGRHAARSATRVFPRPQIPTSANRNR